MNDPFLRKIFYLPVIIIKHNSNSQCLIKKDRVVRVRAAKLLFFMSLSLNSFQSAHSDASAGSAVNTRLPAEAFGEGGLKNKALNPSTSSG